MVSGIFTDMCHQHHNQFKNIFITPGRNSIPISSHLSFSLFTPRNARQPLPNPLSVSIDLPILDIS